MRTENDFEMICERLFATVILHFFPFSGAFSRRYNSLGIWGGVGAEGVGDGQGEREGGDGKGRRRRRDRKERKRINI